MRQAESQKLGMVPGGGGGLLRVLRRVSISYVECGRVCCGDECLNLTCV